MGNTKKRNIYNYFLNIDEYNLPKKDGVFLEDSKRMNNFNYTECKRYDISKFRLDGVPFYYKPSISEGFDSKDINAMTACKVYSDLGFITPPVYPVKGKIGPETVYSTITQDIHTIDGISCSIGKNAGLPRNTNTSLSNPKYGYKWQVLKDEDLRRKFLSIMTPECLEEFINLFLLGELRTDNDMHSLNYFFYKTDTDTKYIGVIPIDLERSSLFLDQNYDSHDSFIDFIRNKEYISSTPIDCLSDKETYEQRIKNLLNQIQNGTLSTSQIEFLKQVISYDMPKSYKETYKKYKLEKHSAKWLNFNQAMLNPINRLQEYNQNTIGRELGL